MNLQMYRNWYNFVTKSSRTIYHITMKRIHMMTTILMLATILVAGCSQEKNAKETYLDEKVSTERRVQDLLSKLTVDEKISLMRTLSPGIERMGIGKYYHGNEALHGVVRPGRFTVFPQAIALGAMWDPTLVEQISSAISDEARARWNTLDQGRKQELLYGDLLTFWSPTVNMARDPRWGRTAETYGEDPFLSGQTGAAFVRGLQGYDKRYLKVVSTPKHFAVNNEEHNRFECKVNVPEKMLREYFLPAFEACVTEGGAQSVMAAYNAINGTPCSCNHWLLTEVLRDEWGFDGYVVSDCGGVENVYSCHKFTHTLKEAAALTLKAGLDLECGDCGYLDPLREAYSEGLVTDEDIDRAAGRVLTARMRLGMFDAPEHNPYAQIPDSVIGCEKHRHLALQSAQESMVLLKNDGILPFDKEKVKTIAVVGINADKCELGDYSGSPTIMPVSILQGIKDVGGENIEVINAPWHSTGNGMELLSEEDFADGITAEYFNGLSFEEKLLERKEPYVYFEPSNQAPDPLVQVNHMSARWSGDLCPEVSGKFDFKLDKFGWGCRVYIDGKQVGGDGMENQFSQMLVKGKKYHLSLEYNNERDYSLVKLMWAKPGTSCVSDLYAEALEAARKSDVVVAAMGYNKTIEREGLDRNDLTLPEDQQNFLKALKEVNPHIVLVLVAGNSLAINWEDENLPAIVSAWYGGEYGGLAVAQMLFGQYNPSGRLPLTYYKSVQQLPPFDDYQVTNGRTYKYLEEEPLYPFGYGLSYTTFDYSDLKVSHRRKGWKVQFNVTNTGQRAGDEVCQVYARIPDYEGKCPIKELKGFARVSLNPGEKKTVEVFVPNNKLRYWSEAESKFKFSKKKPEIMVGANSADIRLQLPAGK